MAGSNWHDAIDALKKAEELAPDKCLSFNAFFLAMAHWQLDQKDQARQWYEKAVTWMKRNAPDDDELIRFRTVAAELIGITEKEVSTQDTPEPEANPESP